MKLQRSPLWRYRAPGSASRCMAVPIENQHSPPADQHDGGFTFRIPAGRPHVRLFAAPALVDGRIDVERIDAASFLRNGAAE